MGTVLVEEMASRGYVVVTIDHTYETVVEMLDGAMATASGFDGGPYVPSRVAAEGLDRPFLLMGSEIVDPATGQTVPHDHLGFDRSWQDFWAHQTGWKRDLLLTTSGHYSYTVLQAILSPASGAPAEVREALVGTIDPEHSITAQRAYLTGFFDLHLRGGRAARHLFAGPSLHHPEVQFIE